MQNRLISPQDNYFQAPDRVQDPSGNIYDTTVGNFELVQQSASLSTVTSQQGDLVSISCSQALKRRKFYFGLLIDDWEEFVLRGRINFLLNGQVVSSIQIQRSYPPPIQIAPFNVSAGATLPAGVLVPATQFDRIVSVDQFTDSVWEESNMVENELRGYVQYDRESDSTVYLYFYRISPIHMQIACNQISFVIDNWTASQSGGDTPNSGVFMCHLACISQQYGST